jgi:hypothetical protein
VDLLFFIDEIGEIQKIEMQERQRVSSGASYQNYTTII